MLKHFEDNQRDLYERATAADPSIARSLENSLWVLNDYGNRERVRFHGRQMTIAEFLEDAHQRGHAAGRDRQAIEILSHWQWPYHPSALDRIVTSLEAVCTNTDRSMPIPRNHIESFAKQERAAYLRRIREVYREAREQKKRIAVLEYAQCRRHVPRPAYPKSIAVSTPYLTSTSATGRPTKAGLVKLSEITEGFHSSDWTHVHGAESRACPEETAHVICAASALGQFHPRLGEGDPIMTAANTVRAAMEIAKWYRGTRVRMGVLFDLNMFAHDPITKNAEDPTTMMSDSRTEVFPRSPESLFAKLNALRK